MEKFDYPHLQTLMDTVIDGFIIIDEVGIIKSFNKSAERIFGYQPEEVMGKNVKILMPAPYESEHDQYLLNYRETGLKQIIGIGREIIAQRKDGSCFPMELAVNEMQLDGRLLFLGTIRDISERKTAEKEIQSYINKLQISNQELDQFAYIASHDLKEPLRGLANNALFLKEDFENLLGDEGAQRLNRMRFLCTRMEQLVDSLLYYSRIGRQELAIENADLNQILQNVQELTIPHELGLDVQLNVHPNLPQITCDVPRVTELFRNLLSNAIKYNDSERKEIEVGVTSKINPQTNTEEPLVFFVKDNGIGIEARFFKDIFRIFKRLNEEDDKVRGTGVGLTFVKKIIERHNGNIWLESGVGRGTCFYFTLKMEEWNGSSNQ